MIPIAGTSCALTVLIVTQAELTFGVPGAVLGPLDVLSSQ